MKSLRQVWDRSLPRPVGETGRRSVGNGKERLRDYAGFPDQQPSVTPKKEKVVSEQAAKPPTIETGRFLKLTIEYPIPST